MIKHKLNLILSIMRKQLQNVSLSNFCPYDLKLSPQDFSTFTTAELSYALDLNLALFVEISKIDYQRIRFSSFFGSYRLNLF